MDKSMIKRTGGYKFQIWPSDRIPYAYLVDNYIEAGTLGNSCMRRKKSQRALKTYMAANCKIAVVTKNNKIAGRALLWEKVYCASNLNPKNPQKYCVLDRIYYSYEFIQDYYIPFVKELWKKYDKNLYVYSLTSLQRLNSGSWSKRATSVLNNNDCNISMIRNPEVTSRFYAFMNVQDAKSICYLPYADTFRYYLYDMPIPVLSTSAAAQSIFNHAAKILKHPVYVKKSKREEGCSGRYKMLESTANMGYVADLDKNPIREALSRNKIAKRDSIYIKRYSGYVHKDNIIDYKGTFYSVNDTEEIRQLSNGNYAHRNNAIQEEYTGELVDKTCCLKLKDRNNKEVYVHKNNVVRIKGQAYSCYDPRIIIHEGKAYLKEECKRVIKEQNNNTIFLPEFLLTEVWHIDINTGLLKDKPCFGLKTELDSNYYVRLVTGEYVPFRFRSHLVFYNKRFYLKKLFKKNSKTQGYLFGLTAATAPLEYKGYEFTYDDTFTE